ncbi:DUF6193 family natural product biosynthesis protein [Streptomyces sp. NPDC088246]|uniref:DUF6193 family natural product biosynthesis protein n=1 Tax=Streptomyces sp. NPDC088246 TaxID=3365842 RepID=UPI00381C1528
MSEGAPTARLGSPEVIRAACAEPRLRALFPFLSHGCLTFHRNTEFPWSNDLPFIAGYAPCSVYAPRYAELLGEALTPQAAAGGRSPSPGLRAGRRRAVAPAGRPHRLSRLSAAPDRNNVHR